jgi:membrane peptidoglycan carboxypeptidase
VTVVDHANGMATMAAAGQRADVHFVTKVMKGENFVYGEKLRTGGPAVLSPQQINDLTYALSQVSSADVNIGWDTAGKTGTWEYGPQPLENAHAWMVGFSRRIAAAVWVGNAGEEGPLYDANGQRVYGSGLPASIWQTFMSEATAAMAEPQEHTSFNQPNYLGDTNPPGSVPSPTSDRPRGEPNPSRSRNR